jgi:hypothetical protein
MQGEHGLNSSPADLLVGRFRTLRAGLTRASVVHRACDV